MNRRHKNQQGFTLLEVLIATLIFSIMSVMGWQLLRGANEISGQMQHKTASASELQRLWLILRRDLYQVVAAEPLITVSEQSFSWTTKNPFSELNDAEHRQIRKVIWQLKEHQLVRTIQVEGGIRSEHVFLQDVVSVKWSFYDGGWKTQWRADARPDRVAAEFSLADGRSWRWVFHTDAGNLMRVIELDNRTTERAAE
ncbi:prepilin-type N-terminal cleavage/methylation domain-containing protein [Pantoea osteomyelitidis]|uniref:Prepilin-type N-terminal cleavage/methylation domain-containing protein n=1 Tax=Pantoea osteomyelitidis TaxID=3230026 RepID=A0ABW7PS36_9GAMM